MKQHEDIWHSPFGLFRIVATEKGIASIQPTITKCAIHPSRLTQECIAQLDQYVAGTRKTFDLPLDAQGTVFQQSVWSATADIPYGSKVTYGQLAKKSGSPKASRAVGSALNKNPLPFIIPCHRVVSAEKGIGGFAFGLPMKRKLLELESVAE